MINIINTTPHDIIIRRENCTCGICVDCANLEEINNSYTEFIYPKSFNPLRLAEKQVRIGERNGIPIFRKTFLKSSIPEKKENTYYIVSLIVAQSFPERNDFLIINDTIREKNGKIVRAKSFAQLNV